MIELKKEELMEIKGGAVNFISGTFITAVVRATQTVFDLGRSLGSAIRRIFSGNICPF